MPKLALSAIETLVRDRRPGFPLKAPFYTAQEILDLDFEAIFGRHWIFIGVEPDVPEPGDYVSVQIDRAPLVIVRDEDMGVRAFHNVCRHRGARLVTEPQGTVGKLVCPYHQWTYELDGSLIHAEHMAADFDASCHGLKPVHLRSVAGLLFVCLADEPPADFEAMATALEPYVAPHGIADAKVAARIDIVEEGNWKLTMENNRECYHCASNHPELTIALFEYGYGFAPASDDASREQAMADYGRIEAAFQTTWEAQGLTWREIDELHGRPTAFRAQRLPLDRAGESLTLDGKAASRKLMGSLGRAKLGGLSVWTQPNSWVHLMSDHVVTFSVLPLAPDRTLLRTTWLVHKDAVEGVDYDLDNLTEVWKRTNEQDGHLVSLAQSGITSPAYEPGPYSPYTEGMVEKFTTWYIERLSAHLADVPAR